MTATADLKKSGPLVYSCSGCSSAAQITNHLALRLDRESLAEMSCIAGVGGDVPALMRTARSGRRIVVLDGCPLQCALSCLARHGLQPDLHFELSSFGIRKRYGVDFDPHEADHAYHFVRRAVASLACWQP
jgi:uncharacterized metal-binding protein